MKATVESPKKICIKKNRNPSKGKPLILSRSREPATRMLGLQKTMGNKQIQEALSGSLNKSNLPSLVRPRDSLGSCSKKCVPKDFSDEEKAVINAEIEELSKGLSGKTFGSHQEAAKALNKSELVKYFQALGIEGWAVIDESGLIKSTGTGFHFKEADGVFKTKNKWKPEESYAWHSHPSRDPIHFGDVKSGIKSGALGIYASGDELSFASLDLDTDVFSSEKFKVTGFDGFARSISNFRNYFGRVDWTLNVMESDGSWESFDKINKKNFK